jgi:hypothetical protein
MSSNPNLQFTFQNDFVNSKRLIFTAGIHLSYRRSPALSVGRSSRRRFLGGERFFLAWGASICRACLSCLLVLGLTPQ